MIRDILISPRENLLPEWSEAFPTGSSFTTLAAVKPAKKSPSIFWLHADAGREQWIVSAMEEISKRFSQAKVVVLANAPSQAEALQALGHGAVGYCHAYSPSAMLAEVKRVVMHDGIWVGRELLQRLIAVSVNLAGSSAGHVSQTLALLTPREKEVALQAAKGLSNKEIARLLKITERTVKAHLSATFERLGVRDRLQLALKLNERSDSEAGETGGAGIVLQDNTLRFPNLV